MTKLLSRNIRPYKGKVYDIEVADTKSYCITPCGKINASTVVHNSAAGCLLSWVIGLTEVDSIRFELYFERFLNPTRLGLPDCDIDFERDTEHIVMDYLVAKYGKERVLNVAAFSTFSEKGTLKDVVRAHLGEGAAGNNSEVAFVTREMPDFDRKAATVPTRRGPFSLASFERRTVPGSTEPMLKLKERSSRLPASRAALEIAVSG